MRPRLNDRLTKAVQFPITLVAAPAGFGKTVALRDFIQDARLDVLRLDLRREDRTLLAFVRGLVETLSPVVPAALAAFPALQQRAIASGIETGEFVDWLDEHLRKVVCTIAIDDLHHATVDPATMKFLADLIERTRARIKWILATRSDVGLPIATWMGYGAMDLPVDEHDLRFTLEETLAAVENAAVESHAEDVKALHELTDGWAVALAIAIRSRARPADVRSAATGVRELLYRFLAEQAFTGLTSEQRSFLLNTCVFSAFDTEIANAFGADADFMAALRQQCGFISAPSHSDFLYHDLFREFVESELHRLGDQEWRRTLLRGGEVLEARGRDAEALRLFASAADSAAVLRVIERSGFKLVEHGEAELVSSAIQTVPEQERSATALGISAVVEANGGDIEHAERLFLCAIRAASDRDLRVWLTYRYALELVRHNRPCVDLLKPYAASSEIPKRLLVPILSTLATAYIAAEQPKEAVATIERAMAELDPMTPDDVQARLYQQAAYVRQFGPDRQRTKRDAERAVELALASSLYDVAARAYSIIYTITCEETDNTIAILSVLDKLGECARKGGSSHAKVFGLIAAYAIEAERGNEVALEHLDRELAESRVMLEGPRRESLLPALAIRAGWRGDFRGAYELLAESIDQHLEDDRRAYRAAEAAFYAFAAGMQPEGERSLAVAIDALNRCREPSPRIVRARLNLGVAELLRGRCAAAHRHISEAERGIEGKMHRLRTLAQCVRVLYRVHMEQAEESAMHVAFERLRSEQMGGVAKLLAAVRFPEKESYGYALLTQAERAVLESIVQGATSKEVASQTGRSPQTVDTHIRSICRKLRCSGRREAVALAMHSGWLRSA
ncbi:MAG: hypothetical protein JO233_02860 [Candidatus Eremiobacteraeota bacterium]|nr:hypothetical protein [Candidatus Eremiobacteraeota bacterium]